MSRPLSDADTLFMPELHPVTLPMRAADLRRKCAWCSISLAAIPDAPRPVFAPDGNIVHTHPSCTAAFREVVNWKGSDQVPSQAPGTSDPR